VLRDSLRRRPRGGRLSQFTVFVLLGVAVPVMLAATFVQLRTETPAIHLPSNVAWTEENLAIASNGDAFRGSLLVKRCDHCHGVEGFSDRPSTPNLASLDRLAVCERTTRLSLRQADLTGNAAHRSNPLGARDSADLAAYYSMLPTFPDPQDNRSFPQAAPIRLRQTGQRSWLPLETHSAAYRLASPAMVPSRPLRPHRRWLLRIPITCPISSIGLLAAHERTTSTCRCGSSPASLPRTSGTCSPNTTEPASEDFPRALRHRRE
jgi:cytochrome c553